MEAPFRDPHISLAACELAVTAYMEPEDDITIVRKLLSERPPCGSREFERTSQAVVHIIRACPASE